VRVIVVGAQPESLGAEIKEQLRWSGAQVQTWGISDEDIMVDVVGTPTGAIRAYLAAYDPDHVICTVGINISPDKLVGDSYEHHFAVNCAGPMRILEAWMCVLRGRAGSGLTSGHPRHFVAVSSNSATVPRSGSAPYCASKAALSQALRCKARDLFGGDYCGLIAYGYEPGLIADTPMTAETAERFSGPLTRMRGGQLAGGVSKAALTSLMVAALHTGASLNGVLIPFDAGER
jgi:NAD(P)-dependent dehydrogenase (short-subunit alcohol dehydrogenase family)